MTSFCFGSKLLLTKISCQGSRRRQERLGNKWDNGVAMIPDLHLPIPEINARNFLFFFRRRLVL